MSSLESFGRLLNETIGGDKLSASKVERVRDAAAKHFNHGSKACAIILKVHRRASPKSRLSSLYLFDSICRYAGDIVRKKGSGFDYQDADPPSDSKSQPGSKQALIDSASSYLYSASGIVEEIVLTTMKNVREDQRPKVTKVVDIWTKANTFDMGLLDDIKAKATKPTIVESTASNKDVSMSDHGANYQEGESSSSPYGMLMQETTKQQTSTIPPQIPVNLLALLGSKGNQSSTVADLQSNGNTSKVSSHQPSFGLDASQLAMLQQIAQNNGRNNETRVVEPPVPLSAPMTRPDRAHDAPGPPPSLTKMVPPSNSASTITQVAKPSSSVPSNAVPPVLQAPSLPATSIPKDSEVGLSFVPDPNIGDLSQFNFAIFDPTSAFHWVQFAQHWHNTYRYVPSNQECLWAMMSAIQAQSYMAAGYDNSQW